MLAASEVLDSRLGPSYVAMFDWVGFDAYDTWGSGYGTPPSYCITGAYGGMCTLINKLRSWLSSSQRMIAMPSTALIWASYGDTSASTQYWMIDTNIDMWQQEVLSDAKYVAYLPYMWQADVPNGGRVMGARDMWRIADRMYEVAYSLIPRGTSRVFPISFFASSSYPDHPSSPPYADYPPANAFDLDTSDMWNSGCYANNYCPYSSPPQKVGHPSVGANFQGPTHLTRIELTTEQDIPGTTDHVLWGLTPSGWQQFGWFHGYTTGQQTLVWTGDIDISAFQVATDVSPTWIAWRDIQFFQ